MKKFYLFILLAIFVYIAGCTQPSDSSITTTTPTTPVKDIRPVNCTVFDANNTSMNDVLITITYDTSKYSDGFLRGEMITTTWADAYGNFSAYLNRSVGYNFKVTKRLGYTASKQDDYSVILNPTDNGCIIKPIIPTPTPTLTTPTPVTWGGSRVYTPREIADGLKGFIDFIF